MNHRTVVATTTVALLLASACSGPDSVSDATPDSSELRSTAESTSAVIDECLMADPIDQILEVDSDVFATTDRVIVHFTPCTLDQPTPSAIIYLLHGAGADETQWEDVDIFAAADAAVRQGTMRPTILVAPDAPFAYPCDDCIVDLLTHIMGEIEPLVGRIAPIDLDRRAIGGISRGGGLALQLAGSAPDDFVAVGAHSSVDAPRPTLDSLANARIPVRLDAGTGDSLLSQSEKMAAAIKLQGGRAEIVVGPGNHDRAYWRSQADSYIAFYSQHLR